MLTLVRNDGAAPRSETTAADLLLSALDGVLSDAPADPFDAVFDALAAAFDCTQAFVLMERAGGGALECVASSDEALMGGVWGVGGPFGVALDGRALTMDAGAGAGQGPRGVDCVGDIRLTPNRPALYAPVRGHTVRGVLLMLRAEGAAGFSNADIALAQKYALLVSHALAALRATQTEAESEALRASAEKLRASKDELAFRANHDALTGLPNRGHIRELVNGMIGDMRYGAGLALAFVDLDNFKRINDFYGHAIGDALLKAFAARIGQAIRDTDLLGRVSGDEFVIVLNPAESRMEAAAMVARIRDHLRAPFVIDGLDILASASIGVALCPSHGGDYDTLRRNADTAMDEVKADAPGGVGFFNHALGRRAAQRMSLEHRLRLALHRNEFQCALQAKVGLRDGAVSGFEALVRWVDTRGAVRPPSEFLEQAGELGLMDGIAFAVLDQVADRLPQLDAAFGRGVTYSINISARQAARPAFMEDFITAIAATGRAHDFILELTEDAFVASGPFQTKVLPLLREAGVRVSIDDFGAGYSSLSLLGEIPADELKVDRSLIGSIHQRPRNQSVLRAVELLGAALGMRIVAEGIETAEERDYLLHQTDIGCGQGYLFHAPQLLDDLCGDQAASALPSDRPTSSVWMEKRALPRMAPRVSMAGRGAN